MKARHYFFLIYLISLSIKSQSKFEFEFNKIIQSEELITSHIGFQIKDINTQKPLFNYNAQKWFSTASTLKLLTTATAYEVLGKDFTFDTKVFYQGSIQNNILTGDIIIKGSGDPTLGSSRFNETAESIIKSISKSIKDWGITKITGNLIFEVNNFDLDPVGSKTYWLDMGNYFGGATWPINLNENLNYITFSRSKTAGDSAKIIDIKPETTVKYHNSVIMLGSKDEAFIHLAPYSKDAFIKGTLPFGMDSYTIKGSISNMFEFVNDLLTKQLKADSIYINSNYKLSTSTITNKVQIWEHKSPSLHTIIQQTNWYSINLYAESILRAIAIKKTGFANSSNGIYYVKKFTQSLLLNSNLLNMNDGSGISPSNMTSPTFMCDFLVKIRPKTWFNLFEKSLSISGVNGTLKSFSSNTVLSSNFIGKSGNLDGISTYAGYLKTKSGKQICVSIFVNNFNIENVIIKRKIEKILIAAYTHY